MPAMLLSPGSFCASVSLVLMSVRAAFMHSISCSSKKEHITNQIECENEMKMRHLCIRIRVAYCALR